MVGVVGINDALGVDSDGVAHILEAPFHGAVGCPESEEGVVISISSIEGVIGEDGVSVGGGGKSDTPFYGAIGVEGIESTIIWWWG